MRVLLGVVVLTVVVFGGLLVGGVVLGMTGRQNDAIPVLIVAALAGALAAEAAKRATPTKDVGKVIATACVGIVSILVLSQFARWSSQGAIAWGSVMLDAAVFIGLFGSWARWQQESSQ
jgi:hypothetical protein